MKYYLHVWKNAFNFKGRARRKEFWMFQLFDVTILLLLWYCIEELYSILAPCLFYAYFILGLIPRLALIVRRLHDIGKTGKYALLAMLNLLLFVEIIPRFKSMVRIFQYSRNTQNEFYSQVFLNLFYLVLFISCVIMLEFFLKQGQRGRNKYGENPKA